jgi:hypothetical protein
MFQKFRSGGRSGWSGHVQAGHPKLARREITVWLLLSLPDKLPGSLQALKPLLPLGFFYLRRFAAGNGAFPDAAILRHNILVVLPNVIFDHLKFFNGQDGTTSCTVMRLVESCGPRLRSMISMVFPMASPGQPSTSPTWMLTPPSHQPVPPCGSAGCAAAIISP